jgi:hypothetical protein
VAPSMSFIRRTRGRGRAYLLAGAAVAAVGLAAPASATTSTPPEADLGVTSLTANAASASHGDVSTFTEVIKNLGPEAADIDAAPQIRGGTLVREICDLGISPDAPNCEYGTVAPGTTLTTKYKVKVTATRGQLVVKGGVFSLQALLDTDPFNQVKTRSVAIG